MRWASLLRKHQANLLYLQYVGRGVVMEVKLCELLELAFAEEMQIGDEIIREVQLFQSRQVAVDFLPEIFNAGDEVITEVDTLYIIKIPKGHAFNARDPVQTSIRRGVLSESEERSFQWQSLSGRRVTMWLEPVSVYEYLNRPLKERESAWSAAEQDAKFRCCLSFKGDTELQFCEFLESAMLKRLQALQLLIVCIFSLLLMMICVRQSCCCMRNLQSLRPFLSLPSALVANYLILFSTTLHYSLIPFAPNYHSLASRASDCSFTPSICVKYSRTGYFLRRRIRALIGYYIEITVFSGEQIVLAGGQSEAFRVVIVLVCVLLAEECGDAILYQVFQNMHANLWNVRHSKERLGILERTYAQKKHIESLIMARSAVDSRLTARNSLLSSKNSCRVGTATDEISGNGYRESFARNNLSLSRSVDHLSLSRNLKTYSSLNRLIKKRALQDQNNKLLCRLITASPTLKRESWAKNQAKNEKYKQNLNRRKRQQVDYSKEAIKLLKKSPRFRLVKMAVSTARSFDRLDHIRF